MKAKIVFEALKDVLKPKDIDSIIKPMIDELNLPDKLSIDIQISNIKWLRDSITKNNLLITNKVEPKKKFSFLKRKSRGSTHKFNFSGIIPNFNRPKYTIEGSVVDMIKWLFIVEFVKNFDELDEFLFYNLNNKIPKYES